MPELSEKLDRFTALLLSQAAAENERTMQEMEELKLVMEGLKDVEEGRVVDGPTAMAEIRREYGL